MFTALGILYFVGVVEKVARNSTRSKAIDIKPYLEAKAASEAASKKTTKRKVKKKSTRKATSKVKKKSKSKSKSKAA